MNNLIATKEERRHEVMTLVLDLLRVELAEDFAERPVLINCTEIVIGVIERESFDVKMAVFRQSPHAFRKEQFDLIKKVLRLYIEGQVEAIGL